MSLLLIALRLGAAPEFLADSQNETAKDETGIKATKPANLTGAVSTETAVPIEPGSAEWAPDGIISAGEYSKNLTLSDGRYAVHWKNDAEDLYMALEGRTEGYRVDRL